MSPVRTRPQYGCPPRNSYIDRGTYLCVTCHHPVAAHNRGRCCIPTRWPSASGLTFRKGQCLCRTRHEIFKPLAAASA